MTHLQMISCFGIVMMIFIAYLISVDRKPLNWRVVIWGVGLQFIFGFIVLKTPYGRAFFEYCNQGVLALLDFQTEGGKFIFNALAIPPGEPGSMGFFYIFQVLTTIVFFSAFISILYYLGVMQKLIVIIAKVMRVTMGTSGAETLSASANIFLGQIEAPVAIRPYLKTMTRSELFCVMVAGMATVSGGILGAFIALLKDDFPDIGVHLLTASVLSAPAGILLAKVIFPEREKPETVNASLKVNEIKYRNIFDAIVCGGETGFKLAVSIGTMLFVFVGLIALGNACLAWFFELFGVEGITFQYLLSFPFAPLAWLMGIPWQDCFVVGELIGEKTVLNEMIAYMRFGELLRDNPNFITQRSMMIVSYALCGFANFMSIGIQVAGIGSMAPERRGDLASLGLRALVGGLLAACMTGAVAGVLVP